MQTLAITRPDDWHLHLRDGAEMTSVLAGTTRAFQRAVVMPNLRPPVTDTALPPLRAGLGTAAISRRMKVWLVLGYWLTR